MASRSYKQFMYSQERQPVMLMGSFQQSGSTGAFATLVSGGITWTAVRMGSAGNDITVALVSGGTAGAEVVTVSGKAISVKIQSGVSTRTQVETAVQASAAASALVSISVASGGTAASLLSATHLATGADTLFISNAKDMVLAQIDTGEFEIQLQDQFFALLYAGVSYMSPSDSALVSQLKSEDVISAKTVDFKIMSGNTPTNISDGDTLYIQLMLRNSGN